MTWALHSMMWPATTPPASWSKSSRFQPWCHAAGPHVTAASVTRPVITMSAPLASASTMPKQPRYALAVRNRVGSPQLPGRLVADPNGASAPDSASSTIRGIRSSPSMYAMVGDRPSRSATSWTASAQPSGSSPPALETTLMPWSRQVPITCSIWLTNVRANPPLACLARMRLRINIVNSASQSPVSTSIGPPSTISSAPLGRSPKKPEQLAIRIGEPGAAVMMRLPRLLNGRAQPAGRPDRPGRRRRSAPR